MHVHRLDLIRGRNLWPQRLGLASDLALISDLLLKSAVGAWREGIRHLSILGSAEDGLEAREQSHLLSGTGYRSEGPEERGAPSRQARR